MLPSGAVKDRIPIAISIAALVVALLGVTGLGEAAQDGVTAGVSKAGQATGLRAQRSTARGPRGPRGRRGPRGYRGYRGYRGFQGPPGDKGDKGDQGARGPSEALSARTTIPVVIDAASSATADLVLARPGAAAGNYAIAGTVTLEGSGGGVIVCEGRAGTDSGAAEASVGGSGVGTTTLPIAFGGRLAATGSIELRCWKRQAASPNVTATRAELAAVSVETLN